MNIKDLRPNTGNIELIGEITDKEDPRSFEKFGKKGKVCKCTIADTTGSAILTLWNDDIEKVGIGDTIKIQNGWCSEYKGEIQLSTGKYGKLEIVPQQAMSSQANTEDKTQAQVFTNDPAMLGGGQQGENTDEDAEGSMPAEEFLEE